MADLADRIAQLSPEKQAELAERLLRARASGAKPVTPAKRAPAPDLTTSGQVFCCELAAPGHFEGIRFRPFEQTPPGPGQVQVRARAVSLNFRDLMIAMSLYPASPGIPSVMGSDYAGEVLACGEGVTKVKPGDDVLVLSAGHVGADGAIVEGSHLPSTLNVLARQVVGKPAGLSFEDAAGVPTVFLTCFHALHDVARLQAGERVLIHSATGGVGLAAIQIARWLGAEVFATAGTEPKREFLHSIGIDAPMDSRTTAFAERIMELTGGEGVDVVLNTLSGEQAAKGLEILRPFGRFLQVDKQDIFGGASLALGPFQRGLSYTAIDLSLFLLYPDRLERLFEAVAGHLDRGDFAPVRTTVFPVSKLGEALQLLSRYQHLGKLVLSYG
jgi:NADPH:quinone reductase-like Zn-dependent oxidoreductase